MITKKEYENLKETESIYNSWSKQFKQKNGWTVIPANIAPPVNFGNSERSKIEVYEFVKEKPNKYFLYVRKYSCTNTNYGEAITFIGDNLGSVRFGREYKSSFGDIRQNITVKAINGCKYYGIYYKSSGDYARIKKYKGEICEGIA